MDERTLLELFQYSQDCICESYLKIANMIASDEDSFAIYEFVAESRRLQAILAKQIAALPETDHYLLKFMLHQ